MKPERIRNSLKFSFYDGIFASAMLGFTENFWVACAEATKVSALRAGLVSTFPHLISSFTQSAAGQITEKLGGRLHTLKKLVAVQWASLFPLIFLFLLPQNFQYSLLMLCAIFFSIGGSLPGPAWLSLMSDHLPAKSRGKYFGWRNRILGSISFGCGLFAGQILNLLKRNALLGFSIIFASAFMARLISWLFLIKMYDPPIRTNHNVNNHSTIPESFLEFVRNPGKTNFVKFALFTACFHFSVNIISPYLAVYMLRDLQYTYATFSYVVFAATLSSIFGMKVWGELSDQFGSLRIVQATTIYISIIPILWFVSSEPLWLVLVNTTAGFAWAGFQLCSMLFVFSEVPPAFRTRAIGYMAALNGIATFLGSYLGGSLLNFLPVIRASSFMGLFLISGAGRIATVVYFLKRLKETGSREHISTFVLYADALGVQPLLQSGKEILGTLFHKKKS